jgi:hypothetical protein
MWAAGPASHPMGTRCFAHPTGGLRGRVSTKGRFHRIWITVLRHLNPARTSAMPF